MLHAIAIAMGQIMKYCQGVYHCLHCRLFWND